MTPQARRGWVLDQLQMDPATDPVNAETAQD